MKFKVTILQKIRFEEKVVFTFENWMKLKTFIELCVESMDDIEDIKISVIREEPTKLPFSGDGLEEAYDD